MSLSPTSTPAEIAAHLRMLGVATVLADELDPPLITVTLPRAAVAAFVAVGNAGNDCYGVLRAALREALEAPVGKLLGLIDKDDDCWEISPNGTFEGRTREDLAGAWGPVREVRVGDPDASRFIAN